MADDVQYSLVDHIRRGLSSFKALTCGQLLIVIMSVTLVIFGNVGQLLALNLWIPSFGSHGGAFTILTLSATTNAVFYGAALLMWLLVSRQRVSFLTTQRSIVLIIVTGLCNATNGIMLVKATGSTPEVLQAFILSSQIIWVFIFVKLVFKEQRSYCSMLVICSFVLSLGGICLGLASQFSTGDLKTDNIIWSCIFAFGMIPGALYNVVASVFLRRFTRSTEEPRLGDEVSPLNVAASSPFFMPSQLSKDGPYYNGVTVKIAMLFTTGVSQALWMFLLLPVDALPWFGSHPNDVGGVFDSLKEGYRCVFSNQFAPQCHLAFWYFVFFNLSYMLNYVGSAWLNMYSPALTSMVTQLSSPIAAVVLIAFPVFNPQDLQYNIGESIGAVILLTCGTLVYTAWEESTKQAEKYRALNEQDSSGPTYS